MNNREPSEAMIAALARVRRIVGHQPRSARAVGSVGLAHCLHRQQGIQNLEQRKKTRRAYSVAPYRAEQHQLREEVIVILKAIQTFLLRWSSNILHCRTILRMSGKFLGTWEDGKKSPRIMKCIPNKVKEQPSPCKRGTGRCG